MSTRLCSWPATDGGCVELHRDGQRFWTRHIYQDGSATIVLSDIVRAHDHYEYAMAVGHVDGPWPFPARKQRNRPNDIARGEHPCDVFCGTDRDPCECGKRTGAYHCPADSTSRTT